MAEKLLDGSVKEGDHILVTAENGKIAIRSGKAAQTAPAETAGEEKTE